MSPNLPPSSPPSDLFQECLGDARREARMLIEKLVDFTRHALRQREAGQRQANDRNAVTVALDELGRQQRQLVEGFVTRIDEGLTQAPQALAGEGRAASLMQLKFDQLELMDEYQVQSRIELARALQMTMHAVEGSLPELNTLSCALQGLPVVVPDRNPFRPEVFLRALQGTLESVSVSPQVRIVWTQQMCALLGKELNDFYGFLNHKLRRRGVQPAVYAVAPSEGGSRPVYVAEVLAAPPAAASAPVPGTPSRAGEGARAAPPAVPPARAGGAPGAGLGRAGAGSVAQGGAGVGAGAGAPPLYFDQLPSSFGALQAEPSSITVKQLRRLLGSEPAAPAGGVRGPAGEGSRLEAFAQQFERQFELGADEAEDLHQTDFDSTLPAALDALDSERDVRQVLQRLARRQGTLTSPEQRISVRALRDQLRREGRDVGPLVAVEVVALMVENITRDTRLPEAVRRQVRELEPALAQLVVADARFFSDKSHPARRLLDELTQRSLAFESEAAPGFEAFMTPVRKVIAMLAGAAIDGPGPFEVACKEVLRAWQEQHESESRQRELAVKALLHAEQRNLLAARLRTEIKALPGLAGLSPEVRDFLLGPWAQVMAQARLGEQAAQADPGHYQALLEDLIWSAQPPLTRANPGRLTRLIPSLLGRLREGLKTIEYPPVQTSAFLEKLMGLHQAAYRPAPGPAAVSAPVPPPAASAPQADVPELPELDDSPAWLAPQEARDSGFLSLPPEPAAGPEDAPLLPLLETEALPSLELGNWVELSTERGWQRSQLTWASPHGTLFLFTRPDGSTQSMTRRMRERLMREGLMRVISSQPVLAGALDEVARTALRNTVAGAGPLDGNGPAPG